MKIFKGAAASWTRSATRCLWGPIYPKTHINFIKTWLMWSSFHVRNSNLPLKNSTLYLLAFRLCRTTSYKVSSKSEISKVDLKERLLEFLYFPRKNIIFIRISRIFSKSVPARKTPSHRCVFQSYSEHHWDKVSTVSNFSWALELS